MSEPPEWWPSRSVSLQHSGSSSPSLCSSFVVIGVSASGWWGDATRLVDHQVSTAIAFPALIVVGIAARHDEHDGVIVVGGHRKVAVSAPPKG